MSLFKNTSDDFLSGFFKQISKDYSIDFKDLQKRYLIVDLNVESVALSKMKKCDLVKECKKFGVSTDGSVVQLKTKIKKARTLSGIKTTRVNTKKKALKKVAPLHNHDLCLEIRKDCPLCQSHGNVMNTNTVEYEMVD